MLVQPLLHSIDNDKIIVLYDKALELLQQLIATPSFSKEEHNTAELIAVFLQKNGVATQKYLNNIYAYNKCYNPTLPSLLLNSHHDTVLPNKGYTKDPFNPIIEEGKLFGLGSNDAGGPLVSLLATFLYFYEKENLPYNIILAATAEEEVSGFDGIEAVLPLLGNIEFAIVGEPTKMHMAVQEKGLLVLDCVSNGAASHVAHENSNNAINNAICDLQWFMSYQFDKKSDMLGNVKMTVSTINAGKQHNVVPDTCTFTVDVRTTDVYTNKEIIDIVQQHVKCEVKPRSLRLNSSGIDLQHSIVLAAQSLDVPLYGSPTVSDQALMPFPSVKMGPGDSLRSHTADEYIYLQEIEAGIKGYIHLLQQFFDYEIAIGIIFISNANEYLWRIPSDKKK